MATPVDHLLERYRATYKRVGDLTPYSLPSSFYALPHDEGFDIPSPTRAAEGLLILRRVHSDVVSIAWIKALPERQGHGGYMLRDLLATADAVGASVEAVPDGRRQSLIDWYERHGFEGTMSARGSRGDTWTRSPRAK